MLNLTIVQLLTLLFSAGGILSSLIIAILLLLERNDNYKATLSMASLLVLSSLTIIDLLIGFAGIDDLNRNLAFLPIRYTLVIGPLIYFYVRFSLFPSARLKWLDAFHFVLPVLQAMFYFWVGFRSYTYKTRVWLNLYRPYGEWEDLAFTVGVPFYILLAFLLIRKFRQSNPQANQQLAWMNRLLVIISLVVVINLFYELVDYSFYFGSAPTWCCPDWFWAPQMLSFSLLLFWMAFNGYLHIRFMRLSNAKPEATKPARKETYNLEDELINDLGEKLELLMQSKKLFLNPDLNLASLASELTLSTKALSLVINETQRKSYNDYVNQYRIDFVKTQLADPNQKDMSVLDIAFDAGFNSKATFNRVFKQATQTTPSEYRKQALQLGSG